MDQRLKKTTKEILSDNLERQSPLQSHFILFAHNIRSMHNIGSLFRSSDAFGIHALWLSGYSPVPPRPEISKSALGAEECVNWRYVENAEESISKLKSRGYEIYGLEQTFNSDLLTLHKTENKRICLILGNEVTGIDNSILPWIDKFVEIPQFGKKHSLNVSVAAGIALYAFLEKSC
jgi:23S rRNA (guanosine2251-2'-O)-methyltransferase